MQAAKATSHHPPPPNLFAGRSWTKTKMRTGGICPSVHPTAIVMLEVVICLSVRATVNAMLENAKCTHVQAIAKLMPDGALCLHVGATATALLVRLLLLKLYRRASARVYDLSGVFVSAPFPCLFSVKKGANR
mmetsp:Transcript_12701/g.25402  ORF Transcript_12701/g.25402 Transcript_12701/m.25402 type:complete len:133 (+) Transcript_12701:88-486(+)